MFEFSQGQRGGSSTFQSWNFAESIWRIFTTTQGYRGGRNHSGCIENKLRKTIGWSYFWALWRALWIQELCKTCAKSCNYLSLCARVPGRSGRERCGGPGFLYRFMKYTYLFCFFLAGNMLLLFRYTYIYICNCICIFAHEYIQSRYICILYICMYVKHVYPMPGFWEL